MQIFTHNIFCMHRFIFFDKFITMRLVEKEYFVCFVMCQSVVTKCEFLTICFVQAYHGDKSFLSKIASSVVHLRQTKLHKKCIKVGESFFTQGISTKTFLSTFFLFFSQKQFT